jgi:CheY-like chemotaxis protein
MLKTQPLRVLVLDAAPFVAEAMALALECRGYEVVHGTDRNEATSLVVAGALDVLVTHGHLPGDNSPCEFAIAASLMRPDLPIVVVTSDVHYDQPFTPSRASTLQKPFDVKGLLTAIADARALLNK